ncbi:hypothetical protein F5878DRAFT_645551 [Lentinula raphanica]|uniref:Uncharacterized protein n=1 Tax=Lentinula raphanica TaxID=153919 RepID=A0AA38P094_9AGAR|nr:hypothetical protein F5878DRAFT_645551 [Lentinula raphanica]
MQDPSAEAESIATRKAPRIRRLPARYITGGLSILLAILESEEEEELEIECHKAEIGDVVKCLMEAEVLHAGEAYVGGALTEPIDDAEPKDPNSIEEAQTSIYWSHWLAAVYEELESLEQKGVYDS